jgi:hypothetical protein
MAILGTWIDRSTSSLVGAAWGGATNVTTPHSLGTTPDMVNVVLRSAQSATAPAQIGALRGNASLNTVQVFVGSVAGASAPTIEYDVFVWYFWAPMK